MNNRTYVIIDAAVTVDFSQVLETSAESMRWNLAEPPTKTVVKFVGETPDFLEGMTQYNHDEIRTVLATSEWSAPPPQ
jgi:hypothetical protein